MKTTKDIPLKKEVSSPEKILRFSKLAINNLTNDDQFIFEKYGQGPTLEIPYKCIHHAFEKHVATQPNAIAAMHLDEKISYAELNHQANRLANILERYGVKRGDHVGLFVQRSIPMLVGLLATLKVGASYVPQHIGVAPKQHLRNVIEAASIKVVLTLSEFKHEVPQPENYICLAVDDLIKKPSLSAKAVKHFKKYLAKESSTKLSNSSSKNTSPEHLVEHFQANDTPCASDTCFVIFTSGTTGKPNGVKVTHENVCNILLTSPGNLGLAPGQKVSQILNVAFDMAAWEIWGCLSHGATLIIRGKNIEDTVKKVDVVISTPSILASLDAKKCRSVKVAAVAGEPCPKPLADTWSDFCTFYNSCGPTETTIINTAQNYNLSYGLLTIGKPTPNNTVYILDENLQPCAIGETGVMWAGGKCVSAGYINNEKLTAERYRPDPFLGGDHMMFNTRDLGRWTQTGELEHLGRVDDQVKIRGFRVELDSISGVLESFPTCYQAVTLKFDTRNLVSFITPYVKNTDILKEHIAATLPYYCVPEFIIAMNELPVTTRGKIDKRHLLELAQQQFDLRSRELSLMEASV